MSCEEAEAPGPFLPGDKRLRGDHLALCSFRVGDVERELQSSLPGDPGTGPEGMAQSCTR